jgi:hypothetical protein
VFDTHICYFKGLITTPQVFLNVVLDDAVEEKDGGEKVRLGMVVRLPSERYRMKFGWTDSVCRLSAVIRL